MLLAYVGFLILFPIPLEYFLGYPPGTLERAATMLIVTVPVLWLALQRTDKKRSDPDGE